MISSFTVLVVAISLFVISVLIAIPALTIAINNQDSGDAGLPFSITQDPVFYVSDVGLNSNSGKTPTTSFRTVQYALGTLNLMAWGGDAVINLAGGTFDLGDAPTIDMQTAAPGASLTFKGSYDLFVSLAVGSITTAPVQGWTEVITSVGGHTVDEFKDKLVITPSLDQTAFVASNTATTLTLVGDALKSAAVTDVFHVVDLTSVLTWTGQLTVASGLSNFVFETVDIALTDDTSSIFDDLTGSPLFFFNSNLTKLNPFDVFEGFHAHSWGTEKRAGLLFTSTAVFSTLGGGDLATLSIASSVLKGSPGLLMIPGNQCQIHYSQILDFRVFTRRTANFFRCEMNGSGVLIANTSLTQIDRCLMTSTGTCIELVNTSRCNFLYSTIVSCVLAIEISRMCQMGINTVTVTAATNGINITEGSSIQGIATAVFPAGMTSEVFLGALGEVTLNSVLTSLNNDFAVAGGASQGCMVV